MRGWKIEVLQSKEWHGGLMPYDKEDFYRIIDFYRNNGMTIRLLKDIDGVLEPQVIIKPILRDNPEASVAGGEI